MGQLVVGLAGAAVGSAFGNPALGFTAGTFLGGLLFPPDPVRIEGPRREDLRVTSSTHGRPIPEGFGVIRMPGNMIWSSGIREVQTTTEVGGKGGLGGPSQEQVSYTYFADCSFAFAQGPAEAILRVWADGKKIFDVRDPGTTNAVLTATTKPGLTMRTYLGTEDQLRCPTIEATEGADNTPAYRGTVYLTLESFDLTDFGNRIPQITAEIAFKASSGDSGRQSIDNTIASFNDALGASVDWRRDLLYTLDVGDTVRGLRCWSIATLQEVRTVAEDDLNLSVGGGLSSSDRWHVGRDTGRIYIGHQSNSMEIDIIDPDSLKSVGSVGEFAGSFDFQHGVFADDVSRPDIAGLQWFIEGVCLAPSTAGTTVTEKVFLLGYSLVTDAPYLLDVTNPANTLGVVWDNSPAITQSLRGVSEPAPVGAAIFWVIHDPLGNNTKTLVRWEVDFAARMVNVAPGQFDFTGVRVVTETTFTTAIWGDAATGATTMLGPVYDETDGNLIFAMAKSGGGSTIWKWNKELKQIQWSVNSVVGYSNANRASYSRIRNGRFAMTTGFGLGSGHFVLIDTIAGTIIEEELDMNSHFGAWWNLNTWFWDDTYQVFTGEAQDSPSMEQYFIGRFTGAGEPLSDVVAELSGDNVNGAGLPAGDYDVTELASDIVRGYAVTRQMTIARSVEPLMAGYNFDGTLQDDKVKFVKRGGSAVAAITQADIVTAAQLVRETRTQEAELPERIDLGHIDPALDHQENMASAKRVRVPVPTMYSLDSQSLDLAIVFTAAEAKEIAERLLYTAWSQRQRLSFDLADRFIRLVPTDVLTLTLDSGSTFELRITKADISINKTQRYEAVVQDQTLLLASNASADTSLGFGEPELPQSGLARLCLIDAPYLRDVDATDRQSIELKYAMAGYVPGWQAGSLWDSDDGFSYNPVGRSVGAKSYGIVTNALPVGYQNLTDTVTALDVAMVEGALASVTDAQFTAQEQVAIIGSPVTQLWEYVSFRDAVQQPNGSWAVSYLRRGRRGTDAPEITDVHAPGELFIVADRNVIDRILLDLTDHNITRFYRGVGRHSFLESAETKALGSKGRPLMPFRPYQLAAAVDGGNNIDFAWKRSNRLYFELNNSQSWNTGPLDEDSEAYEVDVLAGPGGVLKRTLAATAEAVQYDNADIITDFGAVPAAITFRVYQKSAQVGRGYGSAETTITF